MYTGRGIQFPKGSGPVAQTMPPALCWCASLTLKWLHHLGGAPYQKSPFLLVFDLVSIKCIKSEKIGQNTMTKKCLNLTLFFLCFLMSFNHLKSLYAPKLSWNLTNKARFFYFLTSSGQKNHFCNFRQINSFQNHFFGHSIQFGYNKLKKSAHATFHKISSQ